MQLNVKHGVQQQCLWAHINELMLINSKSIGRETSGEIRLVQGPHREATPGPKHSPDPQRSENEQIS